MKIHSVFALLLVLASLSLAAAERMSREHGTAASSSTVREDAGTEPSTVAAEPVESGYWAAWTEAAAH
jgi:hypothetical protein